VGVGDGDAVESSSFDTLASAAQALRADNKRLRAELATCGRLPLARRGVRFVVITAWLAAAAGAGVCGAGYARTVHAARRVADKNEACWADLDARGQALAASSLHLDGEFAASTLRAAVDECRSWWPVDPVRCTAIDWESPPEWADACVCR
jgi:hypothetical protein